MIPNPSCSVRGRGRDAAPGSGPGLSEAALTRNPARLHRSPPRPTLSRLTGDAGLAVRLGRQLEGEGLARALRMLSGKGRPPRREKAGDSEGWMSIDLIMIKSIEPREDRGRDVPAVGPGGVTAGSVRPAMTRPTAACGACDCGGPVTGPTCRQQTPPEKAFFSSHLTTPKIYRPFRNSGVKLKGVLVFLQRLKVCIYCER